MERKELILQTALQLFSEQGYDTTPTNQIARVAGVSEGLIFKHFNTKEGLMDVLLERGNERIGTYITDILEIPVPRQRIEASIDLPYKLLTGERAYWTLLFSLKWQNSYRKAADREVKYILPLQRSLTEAFALLKFPNPHREVALLFIFLEGLSSQLLTQPYTAEIESTIQLMKSKYYQ